jgi:hypothetical protein
MSAFHSIDRILRGVNMLHRVSFCASLSRSEKKERRVLSWSVDVILIGA